ncbi:MAG: Bro-N domain-containing protein [Proteobacteria bacterium]|nr:Bro-N domain-containing protein [Pseudomonadota bacterium]
MNKDVNPPQAQRGLIVFESTDIRRMWHQDAWWFSVVDVCGALTGSADAGAYWRKLKQRLVAEAGQPVTFCHGLKMPAADGRQRETDCANTEGLLRVIQSIPSPKAEPFKRWLAQVGYERIQEIEAPELASARQGGTIAGDARKALEEKTGQPVVSANNHLALQTTPAAAVAITTFVETQTEALVQKGQGKTTACKKVVSKVAQTVADLKRPAGKKK